MAGQMKVNYGNFETWAAQISGKNDKLIEDLRNIKELIACRATGRVIPQSPSEARLPVWKLGSSSILTWWIIM